MGANSSLTAAVLRQIAYRENSPASGAPPGARSVDRLECRLQNSGVKACLFIGETPVSHIAAFLNRHASRLRRGSAAVAALSLLALAWALPTQALLEQLREWAEQRASGGLAAFAGVYLAFTICCLPVWPLPFLAGALFGTLTGAVVASGSCVLAAATTFGIARGLRQSVLRSYLERSPRVQALEQTIEEADWKSVAAVRVSHFLPFGVQNYAFGLTSIRFWTFALTTWLVTLPGTVLQVHLGHLGFTSLDAWRNESPGGWQQWAWRGVGLLVLAAAAAYIAWMGRSVYRRVVQAKLEARLHDVERDACAGRAWPVGTLLLAGLCTVLLAAAVWSCANPERLRTGVERFLSAGDRTSEATG